MNQSQPSNPNPNPSTQIHIGGDLKGQFAMGESISQSQNIKVNSPEVTQADLALLQQMFTTLKQQVAASAPAEKQAAALERVEELEIAVTAEKPDLTVMQYVKNWFTKHLPQLSGAVTSVVIHPIVGKLVEAAGEMVAEDFRDRFSANP